MHVANENAKVGSQRGAGLAEYAILLALVAGASVTVLTALGLKISSVIDATAGMF